MCISNSECKPREISMASANFGKPSHDWWNFFWTEQKCKARQCKKCLRLEWNNNGGFVEAPLV